MNPEQLSKLTKSYLLPSVPGATLARVLDLYSGSEFTAEDLLHLLEANPACAHSILKQKLLAQKIAQWIQEDAKRTDQIGLLTKRVVGLLGKAAVRNLIASYRLSRMTNAGMPRKKDEEVTLNPQQQIPFAIKTENYCQDRQWAFAEMSFIGGLHYDWLTALLAYQKAPDDAKKILPEAFQEGLLCAQYAYKIGQQIKGVRLDRFVFSAALVLPLGKALMCTIFPKGISPSAWSVSMADWAKYGKYRADAEDFFEKKIFQVTHRTLSAFYVEAMGTLASAGPAIRYSAEPWHLLGGDPDQYQLAMVLSMATTLTRAGALKPSEHLPLRDFQKKWMKQSGMKEGVLQKALIGLTK